MNAPNDRQLEIAEAAVASTLTAVAKQHGVTVERVRQIALKVARYREWHAIHLAELALPLGERRVEYMGFPAPVRNALLWEGIETGEQLAALDRKTVLYTPHAGRATWREIEKYLRENP
ncbi:hypothetical protein HZF05_11080 [Sphingomonas sp. CGMCC 1.13654]|uniref:Uncharacterized protein n=1 Tax=Sphingomonas chungangi TaxID=2683589 RepID=A0A838LAX2_9SPHN|nr:hypothetical protein [Sphingomonas chungangi]MBA2934638.1 hypothetical protein [Sphingomonas chungangi]MVW57673.1 hypothetical protein [Sphingomonas chungangi]